MSFSTSTSRKSRIPDGGGWRADPVPARQGSGTGWGYLHVAVDDRSWVAYAELLGDERGATCAAFARRCLASFAAMGVRVVRAMTDNGPDYRSREFNAALSGLGVRHLHARPHGPWQYGKVKRMDRTIAQEWQYGRAWSAEAEQTSALPAFIEHYNLGVHTAPAGASRPCRT